LPTVMALLNRWLASPPIYERSKEVFENPPTHFRTSFSASPTPTRYISG
jgi:hypothetical protein